MKKLIVFISINLLLFSCNIEKKLIYFQNEASNSSINKYSNPKIKVDDLLSISVYSSNLEASIPFNLPVPIQQLNNGYTQGNQAPPGYLVDNDGNINFPFIGLLYVKDLSRQELTKILEFKLKDYLDKPIVSIKILNFKITVLGEVTHPATYTIPNERITILEAIGLAGDLTIMGKRTNVLVIRDNDGNKTKYRIDLTNSSLLDSPVYYLQQNDVVYIEPNKAKINSSRLNTSNIGIIISAISLIVTTSVLIFK